MRAIGRGGGEGMGQGRKGKGKGGKEGSTPPGFSNTPQFELSGNKPGRLERFSIGGCLKIEAKSSVTLCLLKQRLRVITHGQSRLRVNYNGR
jgi:hypothetical protein